MSTERRAILASLNKLLDSLDDAALVLVTPVRGGQVSFLIPPAERIITRSDHCKDDIIAVLTEINKRLTTTKLLTALEERDKIWGESTVKAKLAEMVRDGLLDNRNDTAPPGYGLPAWSES